MTHRRCAPVLQAHLFKPFIDPVCEIGKAIGLSIKREVFLWGQIRIQEAVMSQKSDLAADGRIKRINTKECKGSRRWFEQRGKESQQSRFPCPIGPEYAYTSAWANAACYAVQDRRPCESLLEIRCFDDPVAHFLFCPCLLVSDEAGLGFSPAARFSICLTAQRKFSCMYERRPV